MEEEVKITPEERRERERSMRSSTKQQQREDMLKSFNQSMSNTIAGKSISVNLEESAKFDKSGRMRSTIGSGPLGHISEEGSPQKTSNQDMSHQ